MSYQIPVLALQMVCERTIQVAHTHCRNGSDAYEIARHFIGNSPIEKLVAILVNGRAEVTGVILIAQGGIHQCPTSIADVMRPILTHQASAFVLAHNHPSGDPTPSQQDIDFTDKLIAAMRPTGILMLDHIVIGRDSFACIPTE